MVRAHWIDVGGTSTGFGAGPEVPDPWQEGLQLDQLKIYEAGRLDEKLHRVIRDNIRFPESSLGDLNSQIAACKLGARRFDELFRKYGRATALRRLRRSSMKRRRNAARSSPASRTAFTRRVLFSTRRRRHSRTSACASTRRSPSRPAGMTIDLSGCFIRAQGGGQLAHARGGAASPTRPLPRRWIRVNEGSFRALEVIIPEGNIMMARYPAPMAGWSIFVPTVVETIVTSLAKGDADRDPGGAPRLLGGSVVFFGVHPESKRRFVVQSIEGGGWGGRPFEDGESATVSSVRATCATARSRASR